MAFDHRQRAHLHHGCAGQRTLSQGKLTLQHHFTQRHRLGRRQVTALHFGVLQHVVGQPPQPQRLGAHQGQILAGLCHQRAAMVLLDQATELSDGVDGFAQVMRGHVDELLQALIGQVQLGLDLLISALGGSQVQIGAPAGAFIPGAALTAGGPGWQLAWGAKNIVPSVADRVGDLAHSSPRDSAAPVAPLPPPDRPPPRPPPGPPPRPALGAGVTPSAVQARVKGSTARRFCPPAINPRHMATSASVPGSGTATSSPCSL